LPSVSTEVSPEKQQKAAAIKQAKYGLLETSLTLLVNKAEGSDNAKLEIVSDQLKAQYGANNGATVELVNRWVKSMSQIKKIHADDQPKVLKESEALINALVTMFRQSLPADLQKDQAKLRLRA